MAKYLFKARYTAEGAKGLAREGGTGRRSAIAKMTGALAVSWRPSTTHSATSTHTSFDVPNSATAAAAALAINQGGGAIVKTVVLIPLEDMDKAGKKDVDYRPPGR